MCRGEGRMERVEFGPVRNSEADVSSALYAFANCRLGCIVVGQSLMSAGARHQTEHVGWASQRIIPGVDVSASGSNHGGRGGGGGGAGCAEGYSKHRSPRVDMGRGRLF